MKIVRKIISLLFSLAIIIWLGIVFYDYYNVTQETEPKFCLEQGRTEYFDGYVDWCKGFGYKVFRYRRDSFELNYEFGPFWISDRTADTK